MKKVISLLFVLFYSVLAAQNNFIEIYGNVKERDYKQNLDNIWVDFVVYDSVMFRTKTDSLGNYKLSVSKQSFKGHNELIFCQDIKEFKKKHIKDTCCRIFYSFYTAVWSATYRFEKIKNVDSLSFIKVDQILDNICGEIRFCGMLFEENSFLPKNNANNSGDYNRQIDTIQFVKCFLNNNPTATIHIKACSDFSEKNKIELSAKRANYVFQKLVELGINPKRIVITAFGDTKPRVTKSQISKAKTKEEKEAIQALNRRCYFNIASWDFENETKK